MDFHVPLRGVEEGEHFVQFYEEPEMLYEGLARYVFEALGGDGKALLVVTKDHAAALRGRLMGRGLDVDRILSSGALSIINADELLPKLLVDGRVDEQAFDRFVGDLVRRTRADSDQSVYVFGELVDLLWQKGEVDGLCRLEQLWNALIEKTDVTLYCAYQMPARRPKQAELARILETHTALQEEIAVPGTGGVLLQLSNLTPALVGAVSRSLSHPRNAIVAPASSAPRAAR